MTYNKHDHEECSIFRKPVQWRRLLSNLRVLLSLKYYGWYLRGIVSFKSTLLRNTGMAGTHPFPSLIGLTEKAEIEDSGLSCRCREGA
jgi:hypothetical protein